MVISLLLKRKSVSVPKNIIIILRFKYFLFNFEYLFYNSYILSCDLHIIRSEYL